MAFIGLKYVVAAPIATETTASVTYGTGFVVGKAITANININTNDVKLYADDVVAETDHGFTDGTVEIGIAHMTDDIQTKMLGHVATSGEITAKATDVIPHNGVGFYAVKMISGARKYRSIWLTKTQASEPNESLTTRQGQTAFGTPSISCAVMEDMTGAWKVEKTHDTEAAAIAWLNTKANIA